MIPRAESFALHCRPPQPCSSCLRPAPTAPLSVPNGAIMLCTSDGTGQAHAYGVQGASTVFTSWDRPAAGSPRCAGHSLHVPAGFVVRSCPTGDRAPCQVRPAHAGSRRAATTHDPRYHGFTRWFQRWNSSRAAGRCVSAPMSTFRASSQPRRSPRVRHRRPYARRNESIGVGQVRFSQRQRSDVRTCRGHGAPVVPTSTLSIRHPGGRRIVRS